MRILIKKAKTEAGNNKNLLNRFIFTFTLIQNVTSFCTLEKTFKDIFNLFCQHNRNIHFEESLINIILNRDVRVDFDSKLEKIGKELLRKENINFSKESSKAIKENSLYEKHFRGLFNELVKSRPQYDSRQELNPYFCPDLFKIILDYMYLAPLWTGIMIGFWQENSYSQIRFTRLFNNVVENYFGHIKNNLNIKDVFPSELAATFYERLQVKYFSFYDVPEKKPTEPKKCLKS